MRIGYLECFSGISGDMLLGALVDAGVPFDMLAHTTAALNVGARLEMRKVSRGGIAGTKVDVLVGEGQGADHAHTHEVEAAQGHTHAQHSHGSEDAHSHTHTHTHAHTHEGDHEHPHDHAIAGEHSHEHTHEHAHPHEPHRSLSAILEIIRSAPLADAVKDRASRAFQLLGEAEAAIHSVPIETVHFHEVGAVDTIVDIVCTAAGCATLAVDRWRSSPLNVGSGTVECAHGILPVPAPATLALLGDAPVYAAGPPMERVTPTGAAILRMLDVQYGPLPAMRVAASGYGAGGRDTPGQPNLVRLLVGEETAAHETPTEPIAIIETVIDDSSPQLIAYVSELLLEAGAWDVYRVGVQMKKGRAGVQLSVLCRPDLVPAMRDLILRETTTIGLHWRLEQKASLAREFTEVQTPWGPVQIKIARWPSGEVANAAAEYEDCRALARKHSIPLKQVMQAAMRAYSAGHAKKETRP
jgi:pyridinium-3,5-bisthiocarboxylic acid mononucleotide nickel chelatase